MSVDPFSFRQSLGSFATGVTVITTLDPQGNVPQGVTVSAFSSLSLDPPLVLFCLGKNTASLEAYRQFGSFAVNVLGEGQEEMSNRFAARGQDRWQGLEYDQGMNGLPILKDCATNLECRLVASHDGGDHIIFVGQVENVRVRQDIRPLIYFRGRYEQMAP